MPKTKKVPAKKSAAKKSPKPVLSKEQLTAILKRVESGQSGLIAESIQCGFVGSKPLHRLLTELLGGTAKYNAMLKRAIKARGERKAPPVKKAPAKKVKGTKQQIGKVAKTATTKAKNTNVKKERDETPPVEAGGTVKEQPVPASAAA